MEEIKSTIDANITPNGEQGITGSVLNRVLNDMVDATEGKLAQLDQEWQEIKDANFNVEVQPHIEKVDMGTATSANLEPDKFYLFGKVESLAINLAPPLEGKVGNYIFQFTTPEDVGTQLSLPLDLQWNETPQVNPGYTYQVSILNNLAMLIKW